MRFVLWKVKKIKKVEKNDKKGLQFQRSCDRIYWYMDEVVRTLSGAALKYQLSVFQI